ncbi:MAG: hypothetical protein AAF824_16165 [Bacteroidota bacterium]
MKKPIHKIVTLVLLLFLGLGSVTAQNAPAEKREKVEKKVALKDSRKVVRLRNTRSRRQRAESRFRQRDTAMRYKLVRKEEKSLKKARKEKAKKE